MGLSDDHPAALKVPPYSGTRDVGGGKGIYPKSSTSSAGAEEKDSDPLLPSIHLVRSVAPNKDMYCLSFRLTREILFLE